MIRLDLGPEPAALAAAREAKIAEALAGATPPTSTMLTGYREPTHRALHQRQHKKCAWCERPVGRTGEPVEHVRPKAGATSADGTASPPHYWWLTWTWENLVFSCASCNSQGNKGNRFWLLAGTPRLPVPAPPVHPSWFDVTAESPVLIHPRREDPLDFIEWRVVDRRQPRRRWRWTIRGRDPQARGRCSIELLGLTSLVDTVNAHLQGLLALDVQLRAHLDAQRTAAAQAAWADMVDAYVNAPGAPFRAASWWALEALWPPAERTAAGLAAAARPAVRWR